MGQRGPEEIEETITIGSGAGTIQMGQEEGEAILETKWIGMWS